MELIRTGGRRRFRPEEREQLLEAYRRSGLTQREFAALHGVSASSLVLWSRKYGRKSVPKARPSFIALPAAFPDVALPARTYAIEFQGGRRLEIARGFERQEVEHLCQILRQP